MSQEDSFSPMVSFNLISFILVFVTNLDLELHQVDVKIVTLNGGLDELFLTRNNLKLCAIGKRTKSLQAPKVHLWTEIIIKTMEFEVS